MADAPVGEHDENACTACRGTGTVLSGLGGVMHEQPCPWCDGGGVRKPEHDAQAHWRSAPLASDA